MHQIVLNHDELSDISAEVLGRGGLFSFKAHGSSMYPFIRDGDILTVQPPETGTLNVGDVAFYRSTGGRLVAHRVVRKKSGDGRCLLTIRGDSGLNTGENVIAEHVLGRVVIVQRGKKVIKIDRWFWKFATYLWIKSYPLSVLFFRPVLRIKRAASFFVSG